MYRPNCVASDHGHEGATEGSRLGASVRKRVPEHAWYVAVPGKQDVADDLGFWVDTTVRYFNEVCFAGIL